MSPRPMRSRPTSGTWSMWILTCLLRILTRLLSCCLLRILTRLLSCLAPSKLALTCGCPATHSSMMSVASRRMKNTLLPPGHHGGFDSDGDGERNHVDINVFTCLGATYHWSPCGISWKSHTSNGC